MLLHVLDVGANMFAFNVAELLTVIIAPVEASKAIYPLMKTKCKDLHLKRLNVRLLIIPRDLQRRMQS